MGAMDRTVILVVYSPFYRHLYRHFYRHIERSDPVGNGNMGPWLQKRLIGQYGPEQKESLGGLFISIASLNATISIPTNIALRL